MNSTVKNNIANCDLWLKENVFPIWIKNGVDAKNGGFEESLDDFGKPTDSPRRALVQARQIYSFTEAQLLNIISFEQAAVTVRKNLEFIENYSLPSGAYVHAVDSGGKPLQMQSELYTQAFMLFGLARAYGLLKEKPIKDRALKLLAYLLRERKHSRGGFTEVKNNETVFQSNPHMHLFEALIAWMNVDTDPVFKEVATEIFNLCRTSFCNNEIGVIAEYFSETWDVKRTDQLFIFEPGHQYEWAWLMLQFEKAGGMSAGKLPSMLFSLSEKHGVQKPEQLAVAEVWSDFKIHSSHARFWPQCERIKAALEIGLRAEPSQQVEYALAADSALKTLETYLQTPLKGLWYDTKFEGKFIPQAAKASSLYHIINAMSEYKMKREMLCQGG